MITCTNTQEISSLVYNFLSLIIFCNLKNHSSHKKYLSILRMNSAIKYKIMFISKNLMNFSLVSYCSLWFLTYCTTFRTSLMRGPASGTTRSMETYSSTMEMKMTNGTA